MRHSKFCMGILFAFRFLKGSLNVNGIYTENLNDVWDHANDHDNSSGLTFSTLEEQLTKRVSFTSDTCLVCVLIECL